MSFPLEGPLPQIDLEGGATVEVSAVDPTTGAAVAGVVFSAGVIYVEGNDPGDLHYLTAPPALTQQKG